MPIKEDVLNTKICKLRNLALNCQILPECVLKLLKTIFEDACPVCYTWANIKKKILNIIKILLA